MIEPFYTLQALHQELRQGLKHIIHLTFGNYREPKYATNIKFSLINNKGCTLIQCNRLQESHTNFKQVLLVKNAEAH